MAPVAGMGQVAVHTVWGAQGGSLGRAHQPLQSCHMLSLHHLE